MSCTDFTDNNHPRLRDILKGPVATPLGKKPLLSN